jgi:uncharacterized protein YfeS
MAASKSPPQAITEKIVALMAGKRIKASEQIPSGVRIIPTIWKKVESPDTAFKEANAARLARAKYDQALTSDDPAVVSAMLSDIEDDGTAGASLLRNALVVLQDQRRTKSLLAVNKMKAHKRDSKAETYRKLMISA